MLRLVLAFVWQRGRMSCSAAAGSLKSGVGDFTFGLRLTPLGLRLPFQIPHDTPEDCREPGLTQRTTAESAAERIRDRPRPAGAAVVVLGDTAYDAEVVPPACRERGDRGIVPAHPERVAKGPPGHRPPGRSRLPEGTSLSRTQPP